MTKTILIAAVTLLTACATQPTSENTTAADYNVQLGLGYLAQDDRTRAKEKLLRATSLAPHTTEPFLALAYYYETVGNVFAAEQAYQKAIKLTPDAGQVNNNYGAFLCSQGHYQQSILYFERAIADIYYNQTASAYENAAICATKMRNYKAAANYAKAAQQQDPTRTHISSKLNILKQQNETNNITS